MPRKKTKPKPKFYLWPDEHGVLIFPDPLVKISRASNLMRARALPRIARKVPFGSEQVHIMNSRIRMGNSAGVGFKIAIEGIFIAWLTTALLEADYNCLTLHGVITECGYDLGLNVETIRRLLIKHTAPGAEFNSKDGLVTFRDEI